MEQTQQILNEKIKSALLAAKAVADCIQELGEVPSSHLYARLMGVMDIHTYQAIIGCLKRAKLVSEDGMHMLKWIGPKIAKENK